MTTPTRALALCLLVLGAGCTVTVTGPGERAGTSTATAGTIGEASTVNVIVTEIVDGDTIDVRFPNGSTDRVRLLGIDTPEVHVAVDPAEFEGVENTSVGRSCLERAGENASASLRDRLSGKSATLKFDPLSDRRGGYDRLLAYVVLNGDNVNYDLVADGYARVYDSEFTESDRFYEAESVARSQERGVWRCRSVTATASGS